MNANTDEVIDPSERSLLVPFEYSVMEIVLFNSIEFTKYFFVVCHSHTGISFSDVFFPSSGNSNSNLPEICIAKIVTNCKKIVLRSKFTHFLFPILTYLCLDYHLCVTCVNHLWLLDALRIAQIILGHASTLLAP